MLNRETTGLVIVDVQGKLARAMHESQALLNKIQVLVQGCRVLELPIVWLEQYPQGLGKTVPEISELLKDCQPLEKYTFNACDSANFIESVAQSDAQQWLVCGIEAHICVYQTALGLHSRGYAVEVVSDCVSSRSKADVDLALNKLQHLGVNITGVEMCLYELIKDARGEQFKKLLPLIR